MYRDPLSPRRSLCRLYSPGPGVAECGHPPDVVAWVHGAKPSDYGRLAPLILEFAGRDDPVALALVRQAVAHVDHFIRRLIELGARRVALMGGLGPVLEPWLDDAARDVLASAEGDAMDGAVLLARRRDGLP